MTIEKIYWVFATTLSLILMGCMVFQLAGIAHTLKTMKSNSFVEAVLLTGDSQRMLSLQSEMRDTLNCIQTPKDPACL